MIVTVLSFFHAVLNKYCSTCIQSVYMPVSIYSDNNCMLYQCTQAIGDGGQGWCNAILYIFFSPTIRRKLFGAPCESCLQTAERKLLKLLESNASQNDNIVQRAVISEINTDRQSVEFDGQGQVDPALNPGVDASGYKIQKYSESHSATGTQSSVAGRYQGSTKGFSVSNMIND